MNVNHFRYFFLLMASSLIFCSLSVAQKKVDVVFLKSGGKVIGRILEKYENEFVIMQLQSEEPMTIQWSEIKAFDVLTIQNPSVDDKLKEEPIDDADSPWRLIYISGDESHVTRLDSLSDTHLFVLRHDKSVNVLIDSIALLIHHKGGHFLIGAGLGCLAGTVLGVIIGAASVQTPDKPSPAKTLNSLFDQMGAVATGMVIGAPVGFVAGGIIGGSASNTTYDLRIHGDLIDKRLMLRKAIAD